MERYRKTLAEDICVICWATYKLFSLGVWRHKFAGTSCMPARSSLSISSAWQASSSGKLRRLRTSERMLKEKRCSMSSLINYPPHPTSTYSFLSLDMPRKAPEVIVDSGFALMSRICMLRGSSVSFIQRRRLLVMEL